MIDTTNQHLIRLGAFRSPTASLNLTAAGAYHGPSVLRVSDFIRPSAPHFPTICRSRKKEKTLINTVEVPFNLMRQSLLRFVGIFPTDAAQVS